MESSRALQLDEGGSKAGLSTSVPAPTMLQAHGVTTKNGDVNLAGRDVNVNVHNHYQIYPDRVDITAVLGAIRNLRIIHSGNLSKATPGTGIWFLKTKMFLIWLDPDGNLKILWGTGIPGAGKTVLMSIVIRELEARAAVEGSKICVCYVYLRYSDHADITVHKILEILVKQTVERHPECALLAEATYAGHVCEKTQPTEYDLLQLLHQFTEAVAMTFYFLDALDEAPDRIQVDLVQKLASLNVRLFITSRPLDAVQGRVPGTHCFPIVAQDGDLDLHIAQEIARSRDLANLLEKEGAALRNEIILSIKSKCGGMFLHASLQLDALCDCISARDVRQTLDSFPSRIEDVYLQTWQRVLGQKANHASTARAVLTWVLNAARPMTIEELQCAVEVSSDNYKFEPDRVVPARVVPAATLIALCRGLVTLEEESRIIRLVHYTAEGTLQGLLRESFPHPHSYLAMVCMSHLAECGFQNTAIRSREEFIAARVADPLLAYASDVWATHARQSLDSDEAKRRIATFVRESDALPAFTDPIGPSSFDILTPFHILAIYDLPISLITPNNTGDPNVMTQIRQMSPLRLASWHGNDIAASSLLAHPEIQVNLVDDAGRSALLTAARYGREQILNLLLARPEIQVNQLDNNGWSALRMATKNGHEGTLKLLLAHPNTEVNRVDTRGWSVLWMAIAYGHEGIVRLLLEHPGIQVNRLDNHRWSALRVAAEQGHEGIVKLLLARPEIQVNVWDHRGWSPLMKAAENGHEGIFKLLLAHPDTLENLVDYGWWSAIFIATRHGHEEIVKLLLARPRIQVNGVDTGGWSVLMLAARYGHEGIVKQLLARTDIQVNLVNDQGWSALMLAAFHGYTSIVIQVLATPEVLVNSINNEGRSALMLAAQGGHEATVGLLLAVTYIDTAIRSATDGHTAMSLALAKGHTRIVQLLQEFDSRSDSDRPSAMDLTLDEVVHPGQLVSDMPFDQETGSECELDELQGIDEFQSSVGDAKMDVDASGPDDNRMQDELSGLGKGIKRYRDEDDSLHGAILDMGAAPEPAHKRRRSAQVP